MVNKRGHHSHHHRPRPKGLSFIKRLADYDHRLTQYLAISATKSSSHGRLRPVWKFVEISCHGLPWLLGLTVSLVFLEQPFAIELIVNVIFALVMDLITVVLLKFSVKRPRPAHNKMDMFATASVDHYSFPSGHATRAAMLAYFAHELLHLEIDKLLVVWLWSGIVAGSRVFLGRHYVSDTVFGYLIGIIEYLWYIQVGWVEQSKCLVVGQFLRQFNYFR